MKISTVKGPWFSIGIHVDFQRKFVDLHVIWCIITISNDYRAKLNIPCCEDCNTPYPFPLDTVLDNKTWASIHPESSEGLLCANCIVERASKNTTALYVSLKLGDLPGVLADPCNPFIA